jgi:WD40 repeat protein
VRIWEPGTGRLIRTLSEHTDWVTGLDISPDGRWVAASGKDSAVVIWNAETGEVHTRFEGHDRWVNRVRFSPDGSLLATASDDRTVRVWSIEPPGLRLILPTRSEAVGVAFLAGGKKLAVGDNDEVHVYPLSFDDLIADPARMLLDAQRAAGRHVEGFDLAVSPPPPSR